MRHWERCAVLCIGLAALGSEGISCSCNDKPRNLCPTTFNEGELCPIEGLVCVWPESKCKTVTCNCINDLGGFYWKCTTTWCSCTCPCGFTATTSCDSLECDAKREDPCPATVADACALVCAPPPDGGPRDGGDGGRRDGAGDGRRDTAADQRVERKAQESGSQ